MNKTSSSRTDIAINRCLDRLSDSTISDKEKERVMHSLSLFVHDKYKEKFSDDYDFWSRIMEGFSIEDMVKEMVEAIDSGKKIIFERKKDCVY